MHILHGAFHRRQNNGGCQPDVEALIYYLITWTTYGYWLPGDPRGFRTYNERQSVPSPARYSRHGEETYNSTDYDNRLKHVKKISGKPVKLNREQMTAAAESIVDTGRRYANEAVISVGPHHVHVLVDLNEDATPAVFCNRVKSKSSLRLSDLGLKGKTWNRRYHAKQLDPDGIEHARKYVESHDREGAIIKTI